MVTPLGFQAGAELVAKARQVSLATPNPDATEREYVLKIAGRLFLGVGPLTSVGQLAQIRVITGNAPEP